MRIYFPERILDRHVGGNTTYTRAIRDGLEARGHEISRIPAGRNPVETMVRETTFGLRRKGANEVVHYSADTGPLLPVRAPSVVTVHGVASRWVDGIRTPRQEAIWRARVRAALRCTKAAITVSESSADDVAEVFGIERDSICVIKHGIDVETFAAPTSLSTEVANQVGNDFVLYLGNIEPRKNLMPLVRAFQQEPLRSAGVRLAIAGKPAWNYAESMAEIQAADSVVHLGFVSDADRIALMQRAALFAFPSLYEGFGFPVLEAMAAGAPVATSRRGSLAEVAGPAWHLDDLTAEGLSSSVARCLSDSQWRAEVVHEGKAWAGQFTWDASVEQHIQVYEKVLAR